MIFLFIFLLCINKYIYIIVEASESIHTHRGMKLLHKGKVSQASLLHISAGRGAHHELCHSASTQVLGAVTAPCCRADLAMGAGVFSWPASN